MSAVASLEAAFFHPSAAELDARDEFPARACRDLNEWGLHHYYVPACLGGRLASYPELLGLIRVVAQQDMTVAVAHSKTLLGGIPVWLAAEPEQARWLARQILSGTVVSLGLTERSHGSDLLGGELTARLEDSHYRLDGEKWLINNATRGPVMAVLARTSSEGGPRGFDLLLVDRRDLDPGTYRCLPKERTHGIRGADISGIAYTGAVVPESARVGTPGSGVETVLKGMQLTRTMCAGLALGAGEHALRRALRLSPEPSHGNRELVDAYADLLGAEALAIAGSRSIHFLPRELSILSAVVKYAVPTWIDDAIAALARTLGQTVVDDAMFQKIRRDAAIVGLFDGSTVVNLNLIIHQFPALAKNRPGNRPPSSAYDVRGELPGLDRYRLSLLAPHGVSLLHTLPAAIRHLPPGPLADLGQSFLNRAVEIRAGLPPARARIPAAHYEAAARITTCIAGAAAIEIWLANRHHATGPLWHQGSWLAAVLTRLLTRLGHRPPADPARDETLYTALQDQARTGQPISLFEERR